MLHIDYDIVRFVGSWPGSCTHNVNFKKLNELFLPKFSISNFRTGVRARGVAAWHILPARRRPAAACIPAGYGPYLYRVLFNDLNDLSNRFIGSICVGLAANTISKGNDIPENP